MSGEQLALESLLGDGVAERAGPIAGGTAGHPPTPEQRRAIEVRDRDVLCEAGAGTGKTRVLVERYCEAVDADGVDPQRVLAFTFTERAAAEMRRRVRVELAARARATPPGERAERLRAASRAGAAAPITTIHGFCRRVLAAHPAAAGLDPRFRVLDAEESARIAATAFRAALDELAASDDRVARLAAGYRARLPGMVLGAHADLRSRGQLDPRLPAIPIALEGSLDSEQNGAELAHAEGAYAALRALLERFDERFAAAKAERSGVDFDDLQLIALRLLREREPIAAAYRERFDHLLVDELQDTNPIQLELVRALSGPETRVFAVGDEHQSIYSFRGADLDGFRAERDRARRREAEGSALVLPLSGSFRSSPPVVAAVNAVGEALLDGFRPLTVGRAAGLEGTAGPASPEPARAPGSELELLLTPTGGWREVELRSAAREAAPSRIAEARFLADRLRELVDREGVDPAGIVVLLRAFTNVEVYAEALELVGLDPQVIGGRGYWSAQQVGDALRLLACIANPLEDEALCGALASPACAASPDALWILRRIAGDGRHLWPALHRLVSGVWDATEGDPEEPADDDRDPDAALWAAAVPAADRRRMARFCERLLSLRERAPLLGLAELVERALETFDYELATLAMPGGRRRFANLLELVRIAGEYEVHEGRDLRGFLDYVAGRTAVSDRGAEAVPAAIAHRGVRVMTIHAAKGLEFDTVAVADLGRGLASGGRPPALRIAPADPDGGGESEPAQVGLRLARPAAASLDLNGYRELQDAAARADAEEGARLVYVAASRARERLLLSGCFGPRDLEQRPEPPASASALARLLPALGIEGIDGQRIEVPAPQARPGLDASLPPGAIAVSVNSPKRLNTGRDCDLPRYAGQMTGSPSAGEPGGREGGGVPPRDCDLPRYSGEMTGSPSAGEPGGREGRGGEPPRPPIAALAEFRKRGSAARSLSYAALADYQRCGYRFLVERLLGLGDRQPGGGGGPDAPAGGRGGRLGFGRAVHELLEWCARNRWAAPTDERLVAALAGEGVPADAAPRALELIAGWLGSPLLARLQDRGAKLRPEVPFRLAIGEGGAVTVIRGTIDLLAQPPAGPPVIVDYKTDALDGRDPAPLGEGYLLQRSLYALAVAEATGADRIETAYAFLERPAEPVTATLGGEQLAEARAGIERLIARIAAREFEVTDAPHRGLCHDCPARTRLCSHPEELTLRSEQAPVV